MEINEYVIKLFQTIKDMEALDFFAGARKLSQTEFRLLREICIEKEAGRDIISSELARRLGITRSAISQIVSKLEKDDIVERVAAPDDRKIAYVRLTSGAIQVYESHCMHANEVMENVVAELGVEKMNSLIGSYDEFITVLRKVREDMGDTEKQEKN